MNEAQNRLVERLNAVDPPKTQAEAAATEVAVIAAAKWDDYAKAIQPTFALSPAEALAQAIPATASFQSRLADTVRLGLTAGLPTRGTTETTTRATDAAGAQTTTSSRETTTAPGQTPTLPGFIGAAPGAAGLQALAGPSGEDPFLKYSVAADLYQEIQILNRVLADAKVRDTVEPYLLRLKVAVVPYRRGLRYDAYSDINFFVRNIPADRSPAVPVVVPLLVTDNLESASDAASAQFVSELAAAVSGAAQGAALGAQLQSLGDRLTSAVANERNALRTVGRLGENAIRVRLGATLQAGPTGRKDYELLPRTHTISLLVLLPRSTMQHGVSPRLGVVSNTVLKEVGTGKPLDPSQRETFRKGIDDIVHYLNIDARYANGGNQCEMAKEMKRKDAGAWVSAIRYRYVVYGEYEAFYKAAKCMFTQNLGSNDKDDSWRDDVDNLWISLLKFSGDYATNAQTIELPKVQVPRLPDGGLTVVVTDDGKAATVARLVGGSDLVQDRLSAELLVGGSQKGERIAANALTFDGTAITATFPSLIAIGVVKNKTLPSATAILMSHVKGENDDLRGEKQVMRYAALRYVRGENATPAPADVEPRIEASRIVARNGEGQLTIGLRLKPGVPARRAYVRMAGAEIATAAGGDLDELGRLKVSARRTLHARAAQPRRRREGHGRGRADRGREGGAQVDRNA